MPILKYFSLFWGVHANRELSDHSRSLALQLLQDYDGHISAKLLLREGRRDERFGGYRTFSWFSRLHCTSFLEVVEILVALTDMGCCDPNGEDFVGYTPLTWAARKGYGEVMKVLL